MSLKVPFHQILIFIGLFFLINIMLLYAINLDSFYLISFYLVELIGILTLTLFFKEREFLFFLILLGFNLRISLSILMYYYSGNPYGLYQPDEFFYFKTGLILLNNLEKNFFETIKEAPSIIGTKNFGYSLLCAILFQIQKLKLFPVFLNSLIDSITAILFLYLLKELKIFSSKDRYFLTVLLFLNPFVIFWSLFMLKDTILLFATVLFFYSYLKIKKYNLIYILFLILSLLIISSLRFYLALILVVTIIVDFINFRISLKEFLKIIFLGLFAFVFILLNESLFLLVKQILSIGLLKTLQMYSQISFEKTQEMYQKAYTTKLITGYSLKDIFLAFTHFMLTPSIFNWQGDGKFLFWGSLVWYFLLPYSFVGFFIVLKQKYLRKSLKPFIVYIILYITIIILLPGINEPRHRLVLIPFFLILFYLGYKFKYKFKYLIIYATILWIISANLLRLLLFSF